MNKWLRRLRGAVGMGLLWGTAWFGVGMAILLTSLLLTGSTGADVPYPVGFGFLGFLGGVAFSAVLGLAEGRRRFEDMSMPRFIGWGAAGGLALSIGFTGVVTLIDSPGFMQNLVFLAPLLSGAGAVCAGGMLAIARKAEGQELPSGDDGGDGPLLGSGR